MNSIWPTLKKLLFALAILIVVLVLSELPYFWQQAKYQLGTIEIPTPDPGKKTKPNSLTIPSLGIVAPILYEEEVSEEKFQLALQKGVVHYPNTAKPGQPGNVYIFGHSSDYAFAKGNFKTVFALLPKIEIGQQIYISNETGDNFVYKVTEKLAVNPTETKYLDQNSNKEQLLTLQTSYPIGTALKRYLVIAELQK